MSHEQTITVGINKKHFNIKTVVKGKKVSNKQAVDFAIKNKTLGRGFDTLEKAVKAAERRTKIFSANRRLGLITHKSKVKRRK